MELIDYIEKDIQLWLGLDKKNNVMCNMDYRGVILGKSDIFKNFRTKYKSIYRICYRNKEKDILVFYKSENEKIISVHFSGVRMFFGSAPWIVTHNADGLLFGYIREGRRNFVLMNPVTDVSQFYADAKKMHLSIDEGYATFNDITKYENDIMAYYDSLPIFKAFTYMLGDLNVFPEKEIIIEI